MTQLQILERKLLLKRQHRQIFLRDIDAEIEELKNQIEIAKRSEALLNKGQAENVQ